MEQGVGVLTGNASMGRVDRRNEEVLRNPRGYDDAAFNKALSSVSALAVVDKKEQNLLVLLEEEKP